MSGSTASTTARAKILVADDNRDSRSILSACLQEAGYHVETALDADEALVKGLATRPDLFILDVRMPRKDGYQLCREVRSNPILKQVPIILVTGLDSKSDRFHGVEAGCDEFLSKPFERSELLARVQTLLRLHHYRLQLDERKTFESVLAHSSDGIILLDASWRVASLNNAAGRLLNLNPATSRGMDLLDWLFRVFHVSAPHQRLLKPTDKGVRFEISRPEQATSSALFLSAVLDVIPSADGDFPSMVLTLRDITPTRKETKLARSFLALISHKLRTPIACITEHCSLLEDGLLGDLNEEQMNSVKRVQEQSARLKELIEKMLSYIQTNDSEWNQSGDAFMVEELVQKAIATTLKRHTDKQVHVNFSLPPGLYGLGLSAESFQIVIETLVDNAVKFCDKPEVVIQVGYARQEEGPHEIMVQDNGPGIPHEEYEKIFLEFYQIEKFFTGNVAGVGLGLPLARRIIEHAGGRVWVTSELGKGSTFHFTLPVMGTVLRDAA